MNRILERYKEQLLDLGKRNPLIYFRKSRANVLRILYPDCLGLSAMASRVTVLPFFESDAYLSCYDQTRFSEEDYLRLKEHFSSEALLGYREELDVRRVLRNICRNYQTQIEEKGINTLFLTFGMIEYSPSTGSERVLAPLLLKQAELFQKNRRSPFELRFGREEFLLNPTLKFFLETEYHYLLPPYQGEEIAEYFAAVEASFPEQGNFRLIRESYLGHFSYTKMVMYEDLKQNEEAVLANPLIRRLLGEETLLDSPREDASPLTLIKEADESQIEAIQAARNGRSFVLQGPPGTGKSQTITNIIGDFLMRGKSVLFVSEKKAALDIVAKNLKQVGLQDFLLELHAHDTDRSAVIQEVHRALMQKPRRASQGILHLKEAHERNRQDLEAYHRLMNEKPEGTEFTPFEVFSQAEETEEYPKLQYQISQIARRSRKDLERALQQIDRYRAFFRRFGCDYRKTPWYGFCPENETFDSLRDVKEAVPSALRIYETYDLSSSLLKELQLSVSSRSEIDGLLDDIGCMQPYHFTEAFLKEPDLGAIERILLASEAERDRLKKLKDSLATVFKEEAFAEDLSFLILRFEQEYRSVFRVMKRQYRRDKLRLESLLHAKRKLTYEEAKEYALRFKEYARQEEACAAALAPLKAYALISKSDLGRFYEDFNTIRTWSKKRLLNAIRGLSDPTRISLVRKHLKFSRKALEQTEFLASKFAKSACDFMRGDAHEITEKLNAMLQSDDLNYWVSFSEFLTELKRDKLLEFLHEVSDKGCIDRAEAIYRHLFFLQMGREFTERVPSLKQFVSQEHDRRICEYTEEYPRLLELHRAELIAFLDSRHPDTTLVSAGSPVAFIIKEASKKRNQVSLSQFIRQAGTILTRLKPCFLMSPLSVSSFLDGGMKFDVVIFDEASQIFPEDAFNAIYRAEQVVIAGDSKQMPPSRFFVAGVLPDEIEEESQDAFSFESLLDLATAQAFPQYQLQWHYRSRAEDLITFSNRKFYGNRLVTFPSALQDETMGVKFVFCPNGTYERRIGTNVSEAETIVSYVLSHMLKGEKKSIGVIAFSQAQQELIEDLLEAHREKDAIVDSLFERAQAEPLFIKNLETVQGDERDIILFSIGYAYDSQGKFWMNFGPLGKRGGERRLNVAITRARCSLIVVSSIHASDIDESRVSTEGPKLLKAFLQYAERGELLHGHEESPAPFPWYKDICTVLRKNGYASHCMVGSSSLKVDIAVEDPSDGRMKFALLCDEYPQEALHSVHDRERLRPELLKALGWRCYRIFSTGWFQHRDVEIRALLEFLNQSGAVVPQERTVSEALLQEEPEREERFDAYPDMTSATVRTFSSSGKIIDMISDIVGALEPVSIEAVYRLMASTFNRSKVTSLVRTNVDHYIRAHNSDNRYFIRDQRGFLWKTYRKISPLRLSYEGSPRPIEEIAVEELKDGLLRLLKKNEEGTREGLFQLLSRILGYEKPGKKLRAAFQCALEELLEDGLISYSEADGICRLADPEEKES